MRNTITSAATGVEAPSRTVLSATWPADPPVPLPGGIPGASTSTTSSVPTTLVPSHQRANRRQWLTWGFIGGASYDLHESVHVADRLHRPPPARDEPGGARDEALPTVEAARGGVEAERDRLVGLAQGARRVATRVLGAV